MIRKNNDKYLFLVYVMEIGEYLFVLTRFLKELSLKINRDDRFLQKYRYDG